MKGTDDERDIKEKDRITVLKIKNERIPTTQNFRAMGRIITTGIPCFTGRFLRHVSSSFCNLTTPVNYKSKFSENVQCWNTRFSLYQEHTSRPSIKSSLNFPLFSIVTRNDKTKESIVFYKKC